MTINVLLNRVKVNIKDDFDKAVKYFADHDIDIEFVTRETNLQLPQPVNNGNDNGQIQYAIKAKDIAKPFIGGDVTIFAFDAQELPKPTDGYITSSAGEGHNFITLKTDEFDDRTEWIWKTIVHELMHSIVKILRTKGLFVADLMDSTWNPNEKRFVTYWNNHDPYAKEGNFASQWREIRRHMTISQGARGTLVRELQQLLREKKYFRHPLNTGFFGSVTRTALINFQRDNGLQPDGICGMKSWRALKKKPRLDISKFGLLPLVERKAIEFIKLAELHGLYIRITDGYRSIEEQNRLFAQGRTTAGRIVTNARGGQSFHNYRVAFDVVFTDKGYNGDWNTLGKLGESLGFVWGGRFTRLVDRPHFELTLGYRLSDFQNNRVDISKYQ